MSVVDFLEEVTGGLRLFDVADHAGPVLVPSFWISPPILYAEFYDQNQALICFGVRPADAPPLSQVELSKELRLRAPTITHTGPFGGAEGERPGSAAGADPYGPEPEGTSSLSD